MASEPGDNIMVDEVLPGTRRLFAHELDGNIATEEIELNPKPTQSPNDPLNWSKPRKIWHTALVCYIVALTAATSNVAGSASTGVNEEYGISYDSFNTGAGVLFIAIGYWTLLSSPMVHLYGRRIPYLIGTTWGLLGNIWFGRIHKARDNIWSQLFVGASESVAEAVVQLSLTDIWFEHQNGTSMGLYTLATSIGTYVGPLIGGYIADRIGWRWIGYIGAIASGFTLILFYFGLEETSFQRDRYLRMEGEQPGSVTSGAEEKLPPPLDGSDEKPGSPHTAAADEESSFRQPDADRMSISYVKPKSYWQSIRLITPAPNIRGVGARQYVNRLWHTLGVFSFPAVWYAGLQWGIQNVALTFYLTVQEDNWIEAPWYYGDAAVGNMNLPCLIGSVIGCFYGGWCSDKFHLWMTKRNNGIMEAEFRLYLMFLCVIVFPAGMLLFGIGSAKGWSWPVPYVGLGFIGFGYGCAGDLSLTYLADSYPEMILEGMVGVAVVNNSLAMIFTFVASYWLDTGIQNCFIELAVLSFVILMTSLPMIMYGKRFRRWTRERYHNFLRLRDTIDE